MNKLAIVVGLLLGGCMASGGAYVSGGATVYTPDLVDVEPGVQVIADYDEPVFYSENYYWRNDGGRWYRSTTYNGGWAEASPPVAVGRINSPDRYRHWHPEGYQPRNRGPEVRDHRDSRPAPHPSPAYGDHHDNHGGPGPGPGNGHDNHGGPGNGHGHDDHGGAGNGHDDHDHRGDDHH